MAADKQVSAASRRRARLSGWVLSQFQVTLAVCGIVVGFLVCFGLGFLSGVWFQTQEQMMPHSDAITLADDELDRERKALSTSPSVGREMTFYSALTSRDSKPEPARQPRTAAIPAPKPEGRPSTAASAAVPQPAQTPESEAVGPKKAEPDQAEKRRSVRATADVSASEPQMETPAAPKPKRQGGVTAAEAPQERFYSVQVGSFRRVEQAYRLQDQLIKKGYQARIGLSIVQGKGAWYRVRVGRYADRGSADKTAQRLQTREKVDVLVMRVSS